MPWWSRGLYYQSIIYLQISYQIKSMWNEVILNLKLWLTFILISYLECVSSMNLLGPSYQLQLSWSSSHNYSEHSEAFNRLLHSQNYDRNNSFIKDILRLSCRSMLFLQFPSLLQMKKEIQPETEDCQEVKDHREKAKRYKNLQIIEL